LLLPPPPPQIAKAQLHSPKLSRDELEFAARRAYGIPSHHGPSNPHGVLMQQLLASGGYTPAQYSLGGVGRSALAKVTHDEILARWQSLDAFIASAQHYGQPSRTRAREVLQVSARGCYLLPATWCHCCMMLLAVARCCMLLDAGLRLLLLRRAAASSCFLPVLRRRWCAPTEDCTLPRTGAIIISAPTVHALTRAC
jgi:hypothetical protein